MQPKKYADMANRARQRVAMEYDLHAILQRYERCLKTLAMCIGLAACGVGEVC